jgi:Zn-dependent metalloprotease
MIAGVNIPAPRSGPLVRAAFLVTTCVLALSGAAFHDAAAASGPRLAYGDTGELSCGGSAPGNTLPRPAGLAADAAPRTVARAFLDELSPRFGIADQATELRVESVRPGPNDRDTVRFQQVDGGVPVLGGELVVSLDADGNALSVGGEALPDSDISLTPTVTQAAAQETALEQVAGEAQVSLLTLSARAPALWIYDSRILGGPGTDTPTLVWRVEVTGSWDVDQVVLVDAQRGTVAIHYDQLKTAKNRQVCDAANTPAQAPCAAPVITEGGAASGIQDVNDAYDYAGDVYDFYSTVLGRDSLDGAGMPLRSTVRFCTGDPTDSCPWDNAAWSDDLKQMVYGTGYAHADDVVGHELTHGVTASTSKLISYYQSGAIDESMSDIFGELIDQSNGKGNDALGVRWLMGEDVPGGAIRSMGDPPAFGDPDRMGSPNYYSGAQDAGGIHINNGVGNKAAFLMVDGGTFAGKTVAPLGITKTAKIFYEADTHLLTSASDYLDLYNALLQACTNLTGTAGITAADCDQVQNAAQAVQMDVAKATPLMAPRNVVAVAGSGSATVSWTPPPLPTHPTSVSYEVTAVAASGATGPFVHVSGGGTSATVAPLTNGVSYTFRVKGSNFLGAGPEATSNAVIPKGTQTLVFTTLPDRTFGEPDFGVTATSSAGLPVTYTATGNCTVTGATVHLTGAGTCAITAAQAGNVAYTAASLTMSFAIDKGSQSIAFASLPKRTVGDADFRVAPTASSGLPVTLAARGSCTISSRQVHLLRAGTCTLTASQGGDANFDAAPSVIRTFTIAPIQCRVPAVKGKTLAAASAALRKAHCRTGTVRYAASNVKKGKVVSQGKPAGKVLPANTKIALVVSRG